MRRNIANELTVFSRRRRKHTGARGILNTMAPTRGFFRSAYGDKIAWKPRLEKEFVRGAISMRRKVQQALTKILENAVEAVSASDHGQIVIQTRNMDLSEPTQDRNVRLAGGHLNVCVESHDMHRH